MRCPSDPDGCRSDYGSPDYGCPNYGSPDQGYPYRGFPDQGYDWHYMRPESSLCRWRNL
jgi:hypothetical protein